MITSYEEWNAVSSFEDSARKARYGVAYLRSICSQFGAGFTEPSPDEDLYALDGHVQLGPVQAGVQIKCTSKSFTSTGDPHISWPLKPGWYQKWKQSLSPVYLVVVVVPDSPQDWINYDVDHQTLHATAAYWTEIDRTLTSEPSSITVSKASRLSPDSLITWRSNLMKGFGG